MTHLGLFEGIPNIKLSLIALACTPYGLIGHGKLGIRYKHSQSLYFSQTAKRLFFRTLVYEQYLILLIHRRIDTALGHQDDENKTFPNCSYAHFYSQFLNNTLLPFLSGLAALSKTSSLIVSRFLPNIHVSNVADFCLRHQSQVKNAYHIVCKIFHLIILLLSFPYKPYYCKHGSNKYSTLFLVGKMYRTLYNAYYSYILFYLLTKNNTK